MTDPSLSRFLYLSRGFEGIWGEPPDGLHQDAGAFFDAVLWDEDDDVPSGGVESARQRLDDPSATEFRVRRPDGGIRWIRSLGGPLLRRDGDIRAYAGIARDITSEKEVEAEHRRSRGELAAMFEALPDLVLVVDHEGRYIRIASGDPDQLYRPEPFLTGRTFHEVFPRDLADRFLRKVHEVLAGGQRIGFRYPLDIRGRLEWFDAVLVPLGAHQVLWVARTVTDRVELEHQLAQANRLNALGQLAGGIAHDFNNVITIIQGTTSLMAERIEDDALQTDLGDIRRAADRGSSLTRQLLAFSRQQVVRPERVRVTEVLEPMGRMLARIIGENIELSIRTTGAPGDVMIDAGQLEQIVANLVVNARHAIQDSGEIRIEVGTVELGPSDALVESGALEPGPHVTLEVEDTGAGMPPEVVERAFEPFFTTKAESEGTGLGLSMVYGTVRQSGGHIEIDSTPDVGTTVRIYLPEVVALDEGESSIEVANGPTGATAVLVVEDEDSVRQVVRRFLESAGYAVHEAVDGEEALERLRAEPDLGVVLTDLGLPRMSGGDLLASIREHRPDAAVIVMSGYGGRELRASSGVQDADAFLPKPFTRSELLRAVHVALSAVGPADA
ncbi:MAG: response regulator, partial [Gemmatimonadota bacterium]